MAQGSSAPPELTGKPGFRLVSAAAAVDEAHLTALFLLLREPKEKL